MQRLSFEKSPEEIIKQRIEWEYKYIRKQANCIRIAKKYLKLANTLLPKEQFEFLDMINNSGDTGVVFAYMYIGEAKEENDIWRTDWGLVMESFAALDGDKRSAVNRSGEGRKINDKWVYDHDIITEYSIQPYPDLEITVYCNWHDEGCTLNFDKPNVIDLGPSIVCKR